MTRKPVIPFEEIGEKKLHELIETFYAKVAVHPDLIPIFPDDLSETIRKQIQFQTQYLGGPNLFTEEHGHPMMRARHNPFPITPTRAEAWLACMAEAMDDVGLEGPLREVYYKRLVLTANHMVNRNEEEDQ
ncbi:MULTISPECIES: globin [unclassified Sporosarcina]|uniref:globin domain-containing protein n=1 Tax=unclassified Sporosarcina TaxID=2647733 RepID=UPI000C16C08E|nr:MULTISPECIES: globin [unclassified Sporosarcina]PIC68965.1 globin [Sporosarcina sp. P16b]PID01057.1 globin [Sporosarcina sp. P2]PID23367.1 globin [Sporosarcina sp. P7]